jgi:O-antigen/teichoic acid export membrane protein
MRAAISFGLPMTIFELSGVTFHLVDRGIIQWKLDETAVGYYTMAYNLAWYVNTLFTMPMDMAAVPMYTSLYEQQGPKAASEFLGKSARFFFLFAFPAIAGVMVVREDIVGLLASKQFLPGAGLVHLILAGFLFYGSRTVLGAGMFLHKRPWLMAGIELIGAILNVTLNLILIPRYKIFGAAYATLIAQCVMAGVFWFLGSRFVPVSLNILALVRYFICAALMALTISYFHPEFIMFRLALHFVGGAVIYSLLICLMDREARELAKKITERLIVAKKAVS